MSNPDDQFLHLTGFIHELDFTPTGTADHPWPFLMTSDNGHGEVSVQIHEDDAEQIIEFLQRHLTTKPTEKAT